MSRRRASCGLRLAMICGLLLTSAVARAQEAADRPAFSLASSSTFTTRDTPAIFLTYRQLERLDFRVYRVADPVALLASLKDPHQLGSDVPLVEQEPTPLERIAAWKSRWRARVRGFFRAQFSRDFRRQRRERLDRTVVRRRVEQLHTFAQVPLLNPSRLVTAWREFLPPLRDVDVRRIPIDLHEPGMYVVEAVSAPYRAYTLVFVSDAGLLAKAAPGQLLLYASNRFSGEPIADCDVRVLANQQTVASGTTGPDGVLTLTLKDPVQADAVVSVATCGREVVAADPGSWYLQHELRELTGYVYTDKPIYRPGHTVHVKALLRWRTGGDLVPFDAKEVELRISDPTDKVVFRARRPVDRFGGVAADVPLGAGAALGMYDVSVVHGDETASGGFEVQEYRKPEFDVQLTPADRFVVQGTAARASVVARYFFGQPVAQGTLRYVVQRQPYYSPQRWTDQGEDAPGWWWGGQQTFEGTAQLDAEGRADISVPTPPDADGRDYTLRIEGRVTDASGREVSGYGLVHATYGPFMVLVRTDEYVARPGSSVTIQLRTLDYAGQPIGARPVRLSVQGRPPGSSWREGEIDTLLRGEVTTDANGRATWSFKVPAEPGDYRVRAVVEAAGRELRDETYFWVPGGDWTQEDFGGERYLELVADRRAYAPGDTARLLIRGAEFDTMVLVTKEAHNVSWHAVVRASGGGTVEVPVTDEDVGDTWVNIAFLKDDRVHRAERRLRVPPMDRQLQIAIEADREVARPGEPARFTVTTRDAAGRPVPAQLSLAVIDEAVYGVKSDSTPDPLTFFYQRTYSRVGTTFSRHYSFVGYSGTDLLMLTERRKPFGLADFKGEPPSRPQVRKEFPDAIYWIADLVTGADGAAQVSVTYPDALTTWRLTARGTTEDTRVGAAVARTTVTKDLIARVITPRFLTQGDEVIVPVIAHNYHPREQQAAVTLEARGVSPKGGPDDGAPEAPRQIVLAPNDERRLDWRFAAGEPGRATFTGSVSTPDDKDAVELTIPVLPFGLKRETARSGSITGAGERSTTLTVPATSNPAARSVVVSLAPSLGGALLGALDFLTSYPYGCTEQTLSSFVPTLVVARTMAELGLERTERLRLVDRQVTAGVRRLLDYQLDEGGWGWWKGDAAHPFMTAYAVDGLLEGKAAGYPVDEWRIRQGVNALLALYREYPRMLPAMKAYALYVLVRGASAGLEPLSRDGERFDHAAELGLLWDRRDDLTAYGRALLLMTFGATGDERRAAELAEELLAEVQRTGDLAWWSAERDPLLDDWADASVDATAAAVQALASRTPDHPVLEAAVRYLMANRQSGIGWRSTKQTAMAVHALTAFMKARKERPAPFEAEVFVNDRLARKVAFGPEALTAPEPVLVELPAREGENEIAIRKSGGGALYWSAAARYYETETPLARTGNRRLAIAREYFALTPVRRGDRTVYRETPFRGTAAPGDVLLVRLTVAGATDWRYLLVEDPLPAGAEALATADAYPLERPRPEGWGARREIRDDRVAFFQDGLPNGRVEFWYLLKVVTPGSFRAMPGRVTPMYVPDVMASTTDERVQVTPAAAGAAQ